MQQKIYVISGLGADHTVFQKLVLPGYELVHIKWIAPIENEPLATYAKRLTEQIATKNPILLGLSFGGMLASEIAAVIPVQKLILLSSVGCYSELPAHYKFFGKLKLHQILPVHWFSKGNLATQKGFGVTRADDREILNTVLNNMDKHFLNWAMKAIINWERQTPIQNAIRIHGGNDLVLPKNNKVAYDFVLKTGGHLMLLAQAEKTSEILMKALKM